MISKLKGIYQIKNTITNEIYIGSAASSFTKRWSRHRKDLRFNQHSNTKLQNSYNKYGVNSFEYSILEVCSKEDCIIKEQYYIDTFNPGFNILRIAGSALGHVVPIDIRLKISHTMKGRQFSEEHKKNLSKSAIGNKNGKFTKDKPKPKVKESTKLKLRNAAIKQWERVKQNEH